MAFTKDSGVRSQDSTYVFSSIAGNEIGQDMAWNYIKDNWSAIVD